MDAVSECGTNVMQGHPAGAFDVPPGYKMKKRKYCRTASFASSPFASGLYPSWDPIVPWNDGKRDRPKGLVCKPCATDWNSVVCFYVYE